MKKLLTLCLVIFTMFSYGDNNNLNSLNDNASYKILAAGISNVDGPSSVEQGATVTVYVTYEATAESDIMLYLQDVPAYSPFGFTRFTVQPGSGIALIKITVNTGTPLASNYRWSAYLTTVGGWWNQRIGGDGVAKNNITVTERSVAADAIFGLSGPSEVMQGSTVTVTVLYESIGDNKLFLTLQDKDTFANNGSTSIDISATTGQASIDITVFVLGTAPIIQNKYRWSVYMSPNGAWSDSLPQTNQPGISVVGSLGQVFTDFASPFSNNMVLQQNSSVKIWGNSDPNETVTLTTEWGGNQTYQTTTDANGKWEVTVSTPAGSETPYTITLEGNQTITLNNILIGEVWLCSGQSNMDMNPFYPEFAAERDAFIAAANDDNIRYLSMGTLVSATPQDSFTATWKPATGSPVGGVSIVAYYFAKKLRLELGVPIGLIENAFGASKIQSWIDQETLSIYNYSIPAPDPQHEPSAVYNASINPIIGYGIKGVIWYQGESDRWTPIDQYKNLHYAMINSWRQQWGIGDFPFYPVQIAPYSAGNNIDGAMWDMWRKAYYEINNTGIVSTIDKKSCSIIHPAEKQYVGDRLAYWALNKDYGFSSTVPSGPIAKNLEVIGSSVKVIFDFAQSGLIDSGINDNNSGFQIAGANGVYTRADVQINLDNSITLSNASISTPKYIRYGFYSDCNVQKATLFNTEGLPAPAFIFNVDETLSIDDISTNEIGIYPIPVESTLNIKGTNDKSPIKIYNTLGMLIKTTSYKNTIDVSDLAEGLYILKQDNLSVKFIKK